MWKEIQSLKGIERLDRIDKYLETLPKDEALKVLLVLEDPDLNFPEELKIKPTDKESEKNKFSKNVSFKTCVIKQTGESRCFLFGICQPLE